jgi:hypothetical protein
MSKTKEIEFNLSAPIKRSKHTKLLDELIKISTQGTHLIFPKEWIEKYSDSNKQTLDTVRLKKLFTKHFDQLNILQIQEKILNLPEEDRSEFMGYYIHKLDDEILQNKYSFH